MAAMAMMGASVTIAAIAAPALLTLVATLDVFAGLSPPLSVAAEVAAVVAGVVAGVVALESVVVLSVGVAKLYPLFLVVAVTVVLPAG